MSSRPGPFYRYYKRIVPAVRHGEKEDDFFDGIDVGLPGLYKLLGKSAPEGAAELLTAIDRNVSEALQAFQMTDPSATVPALARGLAATRDAIRALSEDRDVAFLLHIKEQQFIDAVNTALGIDLSAEARIEAPADPVSSFSRPPAMGPVVPGQTFRRGYDVIRHRDLETRYLYRDAVSRVRGVDVELPRGLNVGYVMGIGDRVPEAIRQLGAEVRLLGESELATEGLEQFDAVLIGTRAYAVRRDLRTYNRRLLDYVREGGNLIVLYNTSELLPDEYAPFPGELPRRAEEVTEEDSPVEILSADHRVLQWPNRITDADFDGWIEQRGSKFWSEWDPAYTAIISTHDREQEPQRGGWLTARYGEGNYTYFAYALHRQLPYGIPGAYRLLANLLSQTKKP